MYTISSVILTVSSVTLMVSSVILMALCALATWAHAQAPSSQIPSRARLAEIELLEGINQTLDNEETKTRLIQAYERFLRGLCIPHLKRKPYQASPNTTGKLDELQLNCKAMSVKLRELDTINPYAACVYHGLQSDNCIAAFAWDQVEVFDTTEPGTISEAQQELRKAVDSELRAYNKDKTLEKRKVLLDLYRKLIPMVCGKDKHQIKDRDDTLLRTRYISQDCMTYTSLALQLNKADPYANCYKFGEFSKRCTTTRKAYREDRRQKVRTKEVKKKKSGGFITFP